MTTTVAPHSAAADSVEPPSGSPLSAALVRRTEQEQNALSLAAEIEQLTANGASHADSNARLLASQVAAAPTFHGKGMSGLLLAAKQSPRFTEVWLWDRSGMVVVEASALAFDRVRFGVVEVHRPRRPENCGNALRQGQRQSLSRDRRQSRSVGAGAV